MNTTNEKARALQVMQSSGLVLDGAHLCGLCSLAGRLAQNVPTHVWAKLFAAHPGKSFNVWAVLSGDAGACPLVHDSMAAQVQFPGQLAHSASDADGARQRRFV